MPRCETHNLSYPERLGSCPRCTTEPDASGLTGAQREQIDLLSSLVNATFKRYGASGTIMTTVLARLLALAWVTETLHRSWPEARLEALDAYNQLLIATRDQLEEAMSLESPAND